MRLRILILFLGLGFVVTACNNSKKHDNPGEYDLELQNEADERNMQTVIANDLKECSFVNNPSLDEGHCPSIVSFTGYKVYPEIPSCNKFFGFLDWNFAAEYSSNECWFDGLKTEIKQRLQIPLDVAMAYEIVPVEIRNKNACFLNNKEMNLFFDETGQNEDMTCSALLLKNVAGLTPTGNKMYFGHVVIAPITQLDGPATIFAQRFKLAFGKIGPSEAPRLQRPRYGNKSFNTQSYREGYAHVSEMTLTTSRYPLRLLDLYDLTTNQPYQYESAHPMFVFGTAKLKYGKDHQYYESTNLGVLFPNFLTLGEVNNNIMSNNEEQQELYNREIN